MGFEIVRAARADRAAVVATVVAAFAADPAFRYFFPDDETYPRQAEAFAGYLFDKRVGLGTVWVGEAGRVVSLWEPPGLKESAVKENAVKGSAVKESAVKDNAPAVLDLPADSRERLRGYDEAVHGMLPPGPFWYLGILATHPDVAGQGLGRRLLAAGVTTAHADGLPAVLETVSPSNVELYRREGWELLAQIDRPVRTWALINHPAAQR